MSQKFKLSLGASASGRKQRHHHKAESSGLTVQNELPEYPVRMQSVKCVQNGSHERREPRGLALFCTVKASAKNGTTPTPKGRNSVQTASWPIADVHRFPPLLQAVRNEISHGCIARAAPGLRIRAVPASPGSVDSAPRPDPDWLSAIPHIAGPGGCRSLRAGS